jgi:triacylglycerol lipase
VNPEDEIAWKKSDRSNVGPILIDGRRTSFPDRPMNTIILVHGFTDSPRRVRFMARYLRRRGWTVHTPELTPSNGTALLEDLAAQLATFIGIHAAPGERLDLIGFSMGGLICRYYLQNLGGAVRTDRFISIASPNNGTQVAKLLPGAGMRQMRPRSSFLEALNEDVSALQTVVCTVFYTPFDFVIVPSKSSLVPFANTKRFSVLSHVMMMYHPAVYRMLAEVLGA